MAKIRCPKIAKEFQGMPCFICGNELDTVGAHILSVGSHPGHAQNRDNIIPLCFIHHKEMDELIGLIDFVEKYEIYDEMGLRGFEFGFKWFIPDN